MITVLHVSTAKTWRGGEQQLANLLACADEKIQHIVLCQAGSAMDTYCRKYDVQVINYNSKGLLAWRVVMAIHHAANSFDIIHTHDGHAHTSAVMHATIFHCRKPIVIHRKVAFAVKGWFSRWKYNHKAVAHIVCVSRYVAEVMRECMRDADKCMVIYDGIDTTKFTNNTVKPPSRLTVGYVAALSKDKDQETFIRVANNILQAGMDVDFVLVGEGPERHVYEALIKEYGISNHITLLGFSHKVPDLLPQLTLQLFTSKIEGLGTSILESFAAGVPVVATNAGGIVDVVVHEETGLLADVGDVTTLTAYTRHLLEDDAERDRLRNNALEMVKGFDMQVNADKLTQLYQSVIG